MNKEKIIGALCIVLGTYLLWDIQTHEHTAMRYQNKNTPAHLTPLRVVAFQDISKSVFRNGVEIMSSSVFAPLFAETHRTIEIDFGCISDSSAHQLKSVTLPAQAFCRPSLPDLNEASIAEQHDLKAQYAEALEKYREDSMVYFSDRQARIMVFQKQVEALLLRYKDHPAPRTDIATAIAIADKQFTYSTVDSARNFLVLNSDAEDTYRTHIAKLKNPAVVILVNADNIASTSLDDLHPISLQSMELAVAFVLNTNQKIAKR